MFCLWSVVSNVSFVSIVITVSVVCSVSNMLLYEKKTNLHQDTQKKKNDGNSKGSPEMLKEVKANWNLVLISKMLLFIQESLHP